MMIRRILFIVAVMISSAGQADELTLARAILQAPRGPFGPHMLQGQAERVDGNLPPGAYYFKSAFRTPDARTLARSHNLYLGNLFTTNYYELMGEVLFDDPDSNHLVDHARFINRAPEANARATIMVRNWILEKYYVRTLPDSNLAQAFSIRMISDYESERGYADYFFDIFLRGLKDEFQFLLGFLLIHDAPVYDAPSLMEARELVANDHARASIKWGANDPKTLRLFAIRNLVHNQMSRETVPEIDRFLSATPEYASEGFTALSRVREIVRDYFAFDGSKVVSLARDIGHRAIADEASALALAPKGSAEYASRLLALSQAVATLKGDLALGHFLPYLRTKTLLLIVTASQFLSKEALEIREPSTSTVRIFLNCAYSEGFLITDNWRYFQNEISQAQTPGDLKRVMTEIIDVSVRTLGQAMGPAIDQWKAIEPRMENFVDAAVKSSSLNALSIFAARIP